VHYSASVKSGGRGTIESRPWEGGTHGEANDTTACGDGRGACVGKRGGSGEHHVVGTDRGEKLVGTKQADNIDAQGGDDVVQGLQGADTIRGGNGKDRQYGGYGNDVIYSQGGYKDLVNCGKGIDTSYVDSKDQVVGCERKR
jgi:Ca2+-binding RTX toxin-like protein